MILFRLKNPVNLCRRNLYSLCGKVVGHYPVCGQLRVMSSFIKRLTNGTQWDEEIPLDLYPLVEELLKKARVEDSIGGIWSIPSDTVTFNVWSDSSSIAIGCCVCVGPFVIENGS